MQGQVPLSEVSGYQSHLKSMTGGAGYYALEFSHYDFVPTRRQQELAAEFKPKEEEE
ncbi:MAG: hypothetical protein ACRESK_04095 [Gammaproteobacteria bacterium]